MYVFYVDRRQIPLWGLETIWRNDTVVGYLRRGEYGYSLGCSIGMGWGKEKVNFNKVDLR